MKFKWTNSSIKEKNKINFPDCTIYLAGKIIQFKDWRVYNTNWITYIWNKILTSEEINDVNNYYKTLQWNDYLNSKEYQNKN